MFNNKKYLDELEQIKRRKAELEAFNMKKVNELEKQLADYERAVQYALAEEDVTAYIKLQGDIAVCNSKLEASRRKVKETYPHYVEDIKELLGRANEEYITTTNNQTKKLEKALLDLHKCAASLGEHIDKYLEVCYAHGLTREELGDFQQFDDWGNWNVLERMVARQMDGNGSIYSKIKEFYTGE